MKTKKNHNLPAVWRISAIPALLASVTFALALAGCDKPAAPDTAGTPVPATLPAPVPAPAPAPVRAETPAPAAVARTSPVPAAATERVLTDYEPPLAQPEPVAVPWAPPPMLAEYPPPPPSPDAIWTGGYWVWRTGWAWAPGRWAMPPRPQYHWVPPYYDHRQDRVVFVDGFWAAPRVEFVRPAIGVTIALAAVGAALIAGHAADGPQGPFLPPPPGSRPGLIVPAPIGVSPVVVVRAPAIVAPGMRIDARTVSQVHVDRHDTTTINRNTTIVNHIENVTIVAPAAATADRRAVDLTVPAHAHLAAAAAQPAAPQPPVPDEMKHALPVRRDAANQPPVATPRQDMAPNPAQAHRAEALARPAASQAPRPQSHAQLPHPPMPPMQAAAVHPSPAATPIRPEARPQSGHPTHEQPPAARPEAARPPSRPAPAVAPPPPAAHPIREPGRPPEADRAGPQAHPARADEGHGRKEGEPQR